MRSLPREAWSYAVLLIILFAIAAIAARGTIDYLEELVSPTQYTTVAYLITFLSLGFMLIAGAFGLWAIQFSTTAETRRRIGRIVDAMDYISDGLLAVDRKAQIKGSNPAAEDIVREPLAENTTLCAAFPCLTDEDSTLLLRPGSPNEVERKWTRANSSRTLRFRSQPSGGITLILVSDITAANARSERYRQIARLQLIGQLARGVAHDFNSLLCGIAGHASLLPRLSPGSPELKNSIEAISHSSERGVALARHLLELSSPRLPGQSTITVGEHLKTAASTVRDSLPAEWQTHVSCGSLPPVGLNGIVLEQIVTNLGLLAADARPEPGIVRITATSTEETPLFNVGPDFAGAMVIETALTAACDDGRNSLVVSQNERETGVIESVIRSMLEETGGKLDCLKAPDGSPLYRVKLPRGETSPARDADSDNLPFDLSAYVANWSVLVAAPEQLHQRIRDALGKTGVQADILAGITSALARIEEAGPTDAFLIHSQLLGSEARGILKALLRLCPSAGITVLSEDPESEPTEMATDVVFISEQATAGSLVTAMIEARSLAMRRRR